MDLLHLYFPSIYDVKYMMTAVEGMHGGLSALADTLQVERIGPMHQAGSDSLLTAQTFFSFVKKHLSGSCEEAKFRGELFGLGSNHTKFKSRGGSYASSTGAATGGANGGPAAAGSAHYSTGGIHYPQGPLHHSTSGGSIYYTQEDLLTDGY